MTHNDSLNQALREELRHKGEMNISRCQQLSNGQLIGEEERLSFLSVEEQDNHESLAPGNGNCFVPTEEIGGENDFEQFDNIRKCDQVLAANARRKTQVEVRKVLLRRRIDVEKTVAKICRKEIYEAETVDRLDQIAAGVERYIGTLPEWFESRIVSWLSGDFRKAGMAILEAGRLEAEAERKAILAERKKVEIEAKADISAWVAELAPEGERQERMWDVTIPEEREEIARMALGLTPKNYGMAKNMRGIARGLGAIH